MIPTAHCSETLLLEMHTSRNYVDGVMLLVGQACRRTSALKQEDGTGGVCVYCLQLPG